MTRAPEPRRATDIGKGLEQEFSGSDGHVKDGEVAVNIDYDLIRQFSHQLYTNSRKAVEELVCNSYDAGATQCHVSVPRNKSEALLVLDNGTSMNLEGLQALWHVAKSPKIENEAGYRIGSRRRAQIGKFGVGKLAAFALGARLTYVARAKDAVRVVSVGERELGQDGSGKKTRFDVWKATESQAREIVEPFLGEFLPRPWAEKDWSTWTLAIVSEIDAEAQRSELKTQYLVRMISRALPLHANFQVWIDRALVELHQTPEADIEVCVDVIDKEYRVHLRDSLEAFWRERLGLSAKATVPKDKFALEIGEMPDPTDTAKRLPALVVPVLGRIGGGAIITQNTLTTAAVSERGYHNNGFFVTVQGKLANAEDPLFGVSQRTHTFWRRFRADVEMPGLDKQLLVQRNEFSESSVETQLARVVLLSLFNFLRSRANAKESSADYEPEPFGKRFSDLSPYAAPLGLQGIAPDAGQIHKLDKVKVEIRQLGVSGPFGQFDAENGIIVVNGDHPAFETTEELEDLSDAVRSFLAEIVAGDLIATGYLRERKVDGALVDEVLTLLDDALRAAAGFISDPVKRHIKAIEETSAVGGTVFEVAVVRAFQQLRISATHVGRVGAVDGVIEFPQAGAPPLLIAVESKGRKGVVNHADLDYTTIHAHQRDRGCSRSVVIAREFQTDGRDGAPSTLLQELPDDVTLLRTDAIQRILELHRERGISQERVAEILTSRIFPEAMVRHVEDVWRQQPEPGLMRVVLQVIWETQRRNQANRPDPGMIVVDPRMERRKVTKDHVLTIVRAVALDTQMISLDPQGQTFKMGAPPDEIMRAMRKRPGPKG
jgi:Histidine kinase-, DNA gyrase B-, and HSP90-like ATPase